MDANQIFRNQILTDGFSVHLQFSRAKRESTSLEEDVRLEDLTVDEVDDFFRPAAVDPGICHLFTASYGYGNDEHELRRCSTSEYYAYIGSGRRNHDLNKEKQATGIKLIESEFPTAKTADIRQYAQYLRYFFTHRREIFGFYHAGRGRTRFYNYQGRQRAAEEIANILIHGGKKYDRCRRKKTKRNRQMRQRNRSRKKRKKMRLRQERISRNNEQLVREQEM